MWFVFAGAFATEPELRSDLEQFGVTGANHAQCDHLPVDRVGDLKVLEVVRDGEREVLAEQADGADRVWLAETVDGRMRVVAHLGNPVDPGVQAIVAAFRAGTVRGCLRGEPPPPETEVLLRAAATEAADRVPRIEIPAGMGRVSKSELPALNAQKRAWEACSGLPEGERRACEETASGHRVTVTGIALYGPSLAVVTYTVHGWRTIAVHRWAFELRGTAWEATRLLSPTGPARDPAADAAFLLVALIPRAP
jgi:hypothetical protein